MATIEVTAAGETGNEIMQLIVGGVVLATVTDVATQTTVYTFQTDIDISADDVRVAFVNDVWDPENGIDYNLFVPQIAIDGTAYLSDDISVFSNAVYTDADGIVPGFGRGNILAANGFFQFAEGAVAAPEDRSLIEISAAGQTGNEIMQLLIDGAVVATFAGVPTAETVFTYAADGTVTADQVRVAFVNDIWDPENGIDYNLFVPEIRIDGTAYRSDGQSVFSNAVYLDEDGIVDGYGRGNILATNGYFQYASDDATPSFGTLSLAGQGTGVVVDLVADTATVAASVLLLGDSFTEGFGVPGGYRSFLFENLVTQEGAWVDFTGLLQANNGPGWYDPDHEGITGFMTGDIIGRLPYALSVEAPDYTALLAGTNDIVRGGTVEDTIANMSTIIDMLLAANPDMGVAIGTTPVIDGYFEPFNRTLEAYDLALAELVGTLQADGVNVTLVSFDFLTQADLVDDIHPGPDGYAAMADAWTAGLLQLAAVTNGTLDGVATTVSADIVDVVGSDAGDRLLGSGGRNALSGGLGDDWIEGRDGNDLLSGGLGRDIFVFDLNDGTDVITDFEAAEDFLYATGGGSFDIVQDGADAIATYGLTTVTLLDTLAGSIHQDAFVFA